MSGGRADFIDTDEYEDLKNTANELLIAEYSNQSTREFYTKRFRYWLAWCDDRDDVDPRNPELDDVKNYIRWLNKQDSSDRKIEHRVRGVRKTYQILSEESVVEENPAEEFYASEFLENPVRGKSQNVRTVKANNAGPTTEWEVIEPEEYEAMLENVPAPRFRNQLILKLAWQLHLRSEEITTIKLEHIVDDENKIWIKDAKKSEEDDDLWFEAFYKDDLQYMLDRWRDKERETLAPSMSEKSDHLLLSHQSEKLEPPTVSRMIKDSAKNADVQEEMYEDGAGRSRWKVTAHTLRRSSATYLANKTDYPIHFLSDDMNHRSVDVTRDKYVREDKEERRKRRQQIDEL